MKNFFYLLVFICPLLFVKTTYANEKAKWMTATGTFEVSLNPQQDTEAPAGRMLINKVYKGDIEGTGVGQMISKRQENGHAVYFAIEEVDAIIGGQKGTFTLLHKGVMTPDGQSLSIEVMPNSGTGDLINISGNCEITIKDKVHYYTFNYQLNQ